MKTKVLVTGANGQLALTIKERYQINQDDINFTFVSKNDLDITNKEQLNNFFEKNIFDYCINCAAYTNVEQAEESQELAFKINAEGVKNLALICDKNEIVLIHISTDYVFDGKKKTPYTEDDKTNPINVYGASKLAGEKSIEEALTSHFIIRTSWLYSAFGKNFVKTIISKLKEKANLQITTSQIGTPTSCIDLSAFIYKLIKSKNKDFGLYHLSAKGQATWYDFAIQIASHFSISENQIVAVQTFSSKAKRPDYSVLNNNKAKQYFKEIPNWNESVNKVVEQLLTVN